MYLQARLMFMVDRNSIKWPSYVFVILMWI